VPAERRAKRRGGPKAKTSQDQHQHDYKGVTSSRIGTLSHLGVVQASEDAAKACIHAGPDNKDKNISEFACEKERMGKKKPATKYK